MSDGRHLGWVCLICAVGVTACACHESALPAGPNPTGAGTSAAGPVFPWPEPRPTNLPAECSRAEGRIRNGIALEADLWFTIVCETSRLDPTKVDGFVKRAMEYRSRITILDHFDSKALPADTRSSFTSEELASLADRVTLLVSSNQLRDQDAFKGLVGHLGSGPLRGVCLPWNRGDAVRQGHYGVTRDAANALAATGHPFSSEAVALIADASQDPDLFDWNTMGAHGQTKSDSTTGLPTETAEMAKAGWVSFIEKYVALAEAKCKAGSEGETRLALYYLGYAMHAIEDVAPHRGRTNPEHAYNAYVEQKNPDEDKRAVDLATDLATSFLERELRGRLRSCAPVFATYSGPQIYYPTKVTTLGFKLQLTPEALGEYKRSAGLFASHKDDASGRVRWFGDVSTPPVACSEVPACLDLLNRVAP
jgi:hypothetical protein